MKVKVKLYSNGCQFFISFKTKRRNYLQNEILSICTIYIRSVITRFPLFSRLYESTENSEFNTLFNLWEYTVVIPLVMSKDIKLLFLFSTDQLSLGFFHWVESTYIPPERLNSQSLYYQIYKPLAHFPVVYLEL